MEGSGRKRKTQPSSAPNIPLQACSARHGPIASSCLRASLRMIIRVRVAGKVWVPGKAERFIFPSQSRRGLSSASDRAPRRDMRRATICMYDATGKPCQPQSRRGSRLFQPHCAIIPATTRRSRGGHAALSYLINHGPDTGGAGSLTPISDTRTRTKSDECLGYAFPRIRVRCTFTAVFRVEAYSQCLHNVLPTICLPPNRPSLLRRLVILLPIMLLLEPQHLADLAIAQWRLPLAHLA